MDSHVSFGRMNRSFSKGRNSNLNPESEGRNTLNPTIQNSVTGFSTKFRNESPLRNRNMRFTIEELDK